MNRFLLVCVGVFLIVDNLAAQDQASFKAHGDEIVKAAEKANARFHAASEPFDIQALSAANADFYDQPTKHCQNPILVRCANSVVHVVRLGLLQLPGPLDPVPLHAAQADLLAALSASDPHAARQAVYRIAEIPLTRNTRQH